MPEPDVLWIIRFGFVMASNEGDSGASGPENPSGGNGERDNEERMQVQPGLPQRPGRMSHHCLTYNNGLCSCLKARYITRCGLHPECKHMMNVGDCITYDSGLWVHVICPGESVTPSSFQSQSGQDSVPPRAEGPFTKAQIDRMESNKRRAYAIQREKASKRKQEVEHVVGVYAETGVSSNQNANRDAIGKSHEVGVNAEVDSIAKVSEEIRMKKGVGASIEFTNETGAASTNNVVKAVTPGSEEDGVELRVEDGLLVHASPDVKCTEGDHVVVTLENGRRYESQLIGESDIKQNLSQVFSKCGVKKGLSPMEQAVAQSGRVTASVKGAVEIKEVPSRTTQLEGSEIANPLFSSDDTLRNVKEVLVSVKTEQSCEIHDYDASTNESVDEKEPRGDGKSCRTQAEDGSHVDEGNGGPKVPDVLEVPGSVDSEVKGSGTSGHCSGKGRKPITIVDTFPFHEKKLVGGLKSTF